MQPSIQMLAQGEIEHIDATTRRILHEVGPLGNFLTAQHTEDTTSTAFENHTKQTIREALAAHQPPELPIDCDRRLEEIIHG